MTNLQQSAPLLSPQVLRRLWFGLPLAAGSVASLLVATGVLIPQWRSLQADTQRLEELQSLQSQVLLMRQQLRTQDIQEETALSQKDKLFRLIAGGGDVSTVLAVLDREARATGVRLDLYEPQSTAAAPTPPPVNAPQGAAPAPPPPSPLQQAGLQPYAMLITAQGTYPQLLQFQRRLETLNLLVIQNNVKLELPAPSSGTPPAQVVTMKFSLNLYGQATAPAVASPPLAPAGGSAASPTTVSPPPVAGAPAPAAPQATSSSAPAASPASPPASPSPAGSPAPARP